MAHCAPNENLSCLRFPPFVYVVLGAVLAIRGIVYWERNRRPLKQHEPKD
jgi:hypothetical protein